MRAECVVDGKNVIGECCFQDPRDGCLCWTDIESRKIFRMAEDGGVTQFVLPGRAGFVLPLNGPGFIVGFSKQIAVADQKFQEFRRIADVEPELGSTRVNDAAVDPFGGVVFGTYDEAPESGRGAVCSVYRLSPDGRVRRLFADVSVSNGIEFSPDGSVMYFADTKDGAIRRFRVTDREFADFEELKPLASKDAAPGLPDGACVDAEGHYWSARVWGNSAVRFSPDGTVSGKVEVPAKGPTCVALGGPELTTLYITSLRTHHSDDELAAVPEAGGLFAAEVDVPGIQQRQCGLSVKWRG